jgi:hypothetical protein
MLILSKISQVDKSLTRLGRRIKLLNSGFNEGDINIDIKEMNELEENTVRSFMPTNYNLYDRTK